MCVLVWQGIIVKHRCIVREARFPERPRVRQWKKKNVVLPHASRVRGPDHMVAQPWLARNNGKSVRVTWLIRCRSIITRVMIRAQRSRCCCAIEEHDSRTRPYNDRNRCGRAVGWKLHLSTQLALDELHHLLCKTCPSQNYVRALHAALEVAAT